MPIRRRITDDDWIGVRQREPWGGPTSKWGEDVNTRLDSLEVSQREVIDQLRRNNELGEELLIVFRRGKRVGLAVIGVLAFLGYSGMLAVWDWLQKHFR